MKNKEEKVKKTRANKGEIARRVLAGVLAILMLLAAMSTFIYYIVMYI